MCLIFLKTIIEITAVTAYFVFQVQQKILTRDLTAEDEIADSVFVQVIISFLQKKTTVILFSLLGKKTVFVQVLIMFAHFNNLKGLASEAFNLKF